MRIHIVFLLCILGIAASGFCKSDATQDKAREEQRSFVSDKIAVMAADLVSYVNITDSSVPIAVMEFAVSEGKAKVQQLGKATSMLLQESVSKDARFRLIEREKLQTVTAEIALGQSGLLDESQVKKAGGLLGAHMIITGSVAEIGEYFIISSRLVDVSTAEIVASASVEIRQENLIAVSSNYVVVKKYAVVPAFQSMIIPGWGQIYNDQIGKSAVYLTFAALSAGSFGLSYLLYQNVNYDEANTHVGATDAYRKWDLYYKMELGSIGVAAVVWSAAVIDAYIVAHKNLKKTSSATTAATVIQPYLAVTGNAVSTGLRMQY